MKLDHAVKVGNTWYMPGMEVPGVVATISDVKEEIVEQPKEEVADNKLTKTDLFRMSVKDLRELAKVKGIEDADNISGSKLKELLVKQLGL